jgi:hypothetical protein
MTSSPASLRAGEQLGSTVCGTRVVVIRVPATGHPALACGGAPLAPLAPGTPPPVRTADAVTVVGKRYVDASGQLELLCTSSGSGQLTCDGVPMTLKTAKPLPASD